MAGRERTVQFTLKARDEYSAQMKAAREAVDKLAAAQARTTARRDETRQLKADIEGLQREYNEAAKNAERYARAMEQNARAENLSAAEARELRDTYGLTRTKMAELTAEIERKNLALTRGSNIERQTFASWSRGVDALRAEAIAARESATALKARAAAALGSANRIGPRQQQEAPANRLQGQLGQMRDLSQQANKLSADYDRLRARTTALGKALAATETPAEGLVADFERSKAALAGLRAEMQRTQAQSAKLSGGFARFERTASFIEGGRATGGARTGAAGGGWWANFTAAIAGSAATAHGRGPLGLRPYELQNLSYQINDLVTQVASGTPVMQAFAQQGGQIAQIFPKATVSILRMIPQIGAMAAAIYPLIAAIGRLRETNRVLEDFSRQLRATVDTQQYDAAGLTTLVRELQRVGVSAEESQAAISSMIGTGETEEEMRRFITVARDAADAWGVDFASAFESVREGFDGTYEALQELDQQFNFLTAAQRRSIRETYESGDAFEANERALSLFADKMSEAAADANGPWSEAARNFSVAWQNVLDWLGSTAPIQAAISAVTGLSTVVAKLTSALVTLDVQSGSIAERIAKFSALSIINPLGVPGVVGDFFEGDPDIQVPPQRPVTRSPSQAELKAREDARIEQREELLKDLEYTGKLVADANREIGENAEKARLKATLDAMKDTGKLVDEAERRRAQQVAARASTDAENQRRRFEASIANDSELQQRQAEAIYEAEQEFAAAGIQLDEDRRSSIRATIATLYELEQREKAAAEAAKEAAKKGGGGSSGDPVREKRLELEGALNDLLKQRKILIDQVQYYDESGQPTQADALREQMAGVNEQILAATDNLEAFWNSVGGTAAAAGLARIEQIRREIEALGKTALVSGKQMNDSLAGAGSDAFGEWAEAVANGENVVRGFFDAFRQGAAEFIIQIGKMIAQQAILNALQGGGGVGGGVGGFLASAINAVVLHRGGVVSGGRDFRTVPASVFAGAPRYHNGNTGNFLRAGERPAILKADEEVLTSRDPRHVSNGGGSSPSITIANVLDPTEVLQAALNSEAGAKVFMNHVTSNRRRISTALG